MSVIPGSFFLMKSIKDMNKKSNQKSLNNSVNQEQNDTNHYKKKNSKHSSTKNLLVDTKETNKETYYICLDFSSMNNIISQRGMYDLKKSYS